MCYLVQDNDIQFSALYKCKFKIFLKKFSVLETFDRLYMCVRR